MGGPAPLGTASEIPLLLLITRQSAEGSSERARRAEVQSLVEVDPGDAGLQLFKVTPTGAQYPGAPRGPERQG